MGVKQDTEMMKYGIGILVILALVYVGTGGTFKLGVQSSTQAGTPPAGGTQVGTCSVPLSVAQTASVGVQNFDTGATVTATNTFYLNPATGTTNPGSTTTQPGTTYQILSNASNFFSGLNSLTTSCTQASPQLSVRLKAVDTAISMSVINSDGLTLNAITSSSTRQTLTASSPTTITLRLQPSALQKHLSGDIGKFAVYYNASTLSQWDNSKVAVSFKGQPCTSIGGTNPTAASNTIWGYSCAGDFTGMDTTFYPVSVTLSPGASWSAGNQTAQFGVAGYDYFAQVTTNGANVAGSIQQGAVKDNGAAIQTMQFVSVYLQ